MDKRRLEMTVAMTPDLAHFSGKVHGGVLFNPLDRVAFSCAPRFSGRCAATLPVDQVVFKEPISVGAFVIFRASVDHIDQTSMEIGIRVEAEEILKGTSRHTNACHVTMVAMDGDGRSGEVPPRAIETETKRRRHLPAIRRRRLRRVIADERQRASEGTL